MKPALAPLNGVLFIVGAVACFAALDTATKLVSLSAPLVMTVWFRYLLQALVTGVWLFPRQGRSALRTRRPGLQLLRGLLLLTSSCFAFLSLKHLPVGEFTAITMITPLVVMAVAALSFGEAVPWTRWLFLLGGFAGALVVIAPAGHAIDPATALPLLVVATNAGYQLVTSRLAQVDAPGTIHFYTGCIGTLVATLALPFSWAALDGATWAVLLAMGVFSTLGHFLMIMGYSRAPVSLLTPYLYFQIAFGTFGGWLVFNHVPAPRALLGIALIAACGAAGTWLAARRAARDAARPAASQAAARQADRPAPSRQGR
jgi:drug/metabolite transporter (DMT)-like permease